MWPLPSHPPAPPASPFNPTKAPHLGKAILGFKQKVGTSSCSQALAEDGVSWEGRGRLLWGPAQETSHGSPGPPAAQCPSEGRSPGRPVLTQICHLQSICGV